VARSEWAALCIATALGLAACGFPDHQFIPDNQFDDASASGGTSGAGGGITGGSGGTSGTGGGITGGSGGQSGSAGSAGATGGGSGSGTGGSSVGGACGNNGECVPAPSGWTGPVAVWTGASSDTAPQCSTSGGYPTQDLNLKTSLNTPAATCPSCSCDPPTGETCPTTVDITYYSGANCGGTIYWGDSSDPITVDNTCTGYQLSHGPSGEYPETAEFDAVPANGSCAPHTTGQANIPPTTYEQARVCKGATTSACSGGSLCVPTPAQSFKLCVYKSGDDSCPQPFTHKTSGYNDFTDSRACSSCDCGAPAGASCSGTIADSTGASCGSGTTTTIPANTCTNIAKDTTTGTLEGGITDTRFEKYTQGTASNGSCQVVPSTVTGSVTKTGQYTLCCTQ
jgi:hypothetical protein